MSGGDPITPDLWKDVTDVFTRALEVPPDRRPAFLDEACGGRPRVRAEVESLLSAHAASGDVLERGPAAPASVIAAASALVPPDRIGPYRIAGVLGRGGMGVVYLAEDTRLGRQVALKAVAAHVAHDEARRERLRREARAAAALNHSGIATVYALEEIGTEIYIAAEYVPGDTLRHELDRGPLAIPDAIDTLLRIARAIAAAHGRGIVHRDLKPENVIRTPSGELKVLDFGLAQIDSTPASRLTGVDHVLGTPGYMAPEQIRGTAVTTRADVFALGVMLYELVAGTNPFAAADAPSTLARILEADPPRLRTHLPPGTPLDIADALDRIVATCLAKTAADRFESAAELAGALEQVRRLLNGAAAPGSTMPAVPVAIRARGRWWWQFHQIAAALSYALLLLPVWQRRLALGDARAGTVLFLCTLAAAVVAIVLRLHRTFAVTIDPAAGPAPHPTSNRWLRTADVVFSAALGVEGLVAAVDAPGWGTLLVGAAAATLVSAIIIEPSTERAAFAPR